MGILEPDSSIHAKVNTMEIDFIIIPGIGFSREGKRLGRGGGYYDRYLARSLKEKKIIKIGIAYSFQKLKKIPINKYDIKLDHIVTEEKFYK